MLFQFLQIMPSYLIKTEPTLPLRSEEYASLQTDSLSGWTSRIHPAPNNSQRVHLAWLLAPSDPVRKPTGCQCAPFSYICHRVCLYFRSLYSSSIFKRKTVCSPLLITNRNGRCFFQAVIYSSRVYSQQFHLLLVLCPLQPLTRTRPSHNCVQTPYSTLLKYVSPTVNSLSLFKLVHPFFPSILLFSLALPSTFLENYPPSNQRVLLHLTVFQFLVCICDVPPPF